MPCPLVSVVIPCYNGSGYLADCIGSVLAQSTHCEIIVVDDGSTDHSWEQARTLLQDHGAGYVLGQANLGPAVARNTGLRMAQGKYVGFLDVDDQYGPTFLNTAVQVMEADPTVVAVFCEIELLNAHRPVEAWQKEVIEQSLPSNLLTRTETVRNIGGFPTHPAYRGQAAGEDCAFRLQLPAHGKVVKICKPLFKYFMQRGSI